MKHRLLVTLLIAFFVLPLVIVQACGPDFVPDVFVRKMRPDNHKDFAQGKLGVLLPTYPRADLAVAFRYLNGGALSADEQAIYVEGQEPKVEAENAPADPIDRWKSLRAKYVPAQPRIEQNKEIKVEGASQGYFAPDYENCNMDAFRTAVLTLRSRAKAWGDKSQDLFNWLKGQDDVFANCGGGPPTIPESAPAAASAQLKADRAYQIAAAQFYAAQFDEARASFDAIGKDRNSSWRGVSRYMVARCLVRKAFLFAKPAPGDGPATFDSAGMKQAATVLEELLKEKNPGFSKGAIEQELNLVRLRSDPAARLRELSAALSGLSDLSGLSAHGTASNFGQNLTDLTWYLNWKLDQIALREDSSEVIYSMDKAKQADVDEAYRKSFLDLAELRSTSPLIDWMITFQSPSREAEAHALAKWKKNAEVFWLLAALSKATKETPEPELLLQAAAKVPSSSPAWETLTYHRLRLLLALGRYQQARELLKQDMPLIQAGGRDSSINLFRGLQLRAAEDINSALGFAPRKLIENESEETFAVNECLDVMKDPKRQYDCSKKIDPMQFSEDGALLFNQMVPVSLLVEAAKSPSLPEHLRRAVAIMAWSRSVLLKNDRAAAQLYPLLPSKLQQQVAPGTGLHPLMTLLRNPGIRPYLEGGTQRSYSYDFVESYGDNWWCNNWSTTYSPSTLFPVNAMVRSFETAPAFLTAAQKRQGEQEVLEISRLGDAWQYLGAQALAYVNSHPQDPDNAETLYLVLRMIRYGCSRNWGDAPEIKARQEEMQVLRASAARVLRQKYPANPWTKKAAPFVR